MADEPEGGAVAIGCSGLAALELFISRPAVWVLAIIAGGGPASGAASSGGTNKVVLSSGRAAGGSAAAVITAPVASLSPSPPPTSRLVGPKVFNRVMTDSA